MSTEAAFGAFENIIGDLQKLYDAAPDRVACDAHPDYRTTRFAETLGGSPRKIQHHIAHVFSCMAENEIDPPVLGVSWDGTGYGTRRHRVGRRVLPRHRVVRSRGWGTSGRFSSPGASRRSASRGAPRRGFSTRSSANRLFDWTTCPRSLHFPRRSAGSSARCSRRGSTPRERRARGVCSTPCLLSSGIRQITNHEGQAAMELEFALAGIETDDEYPFDSRDRADEFRAVDDPSFRRWVGAARNARMIHKQGVVIADWEPMVRAILRTSQRRRRGLISAKFHNTLAERHRENGARNRRKPGRSHRRVFSEPVPHREDGDAPRARRAPSVLAPEDTAERRRDRSGAGRAADFYESTRR